MVTNIDDIISRLRNEEQIDLAEIENAEQLKKKFEDTKNLKGLSAEAFEARKKSLTNNFRDFFDGSSDVLGEVANTSISKIQSTDSIAIINRLEKNAQSLPSDVEDEILQQAEDRKVELVLDNIKEEVKSDIKLFDDLSPTKLANVLGGSGLTLTTLSAQQIKAKVLGGEEITEDDIDFT